MTEPKITELQSGLNTAFINNDLEEIKNDLISNNYLKRKNEKKRNKMNKSTKNLNIFSHFLLTNRACLSIILFIIFI